MLSPSKGGNLGTTSKKSKGAGFGPNENDLASPTKLFGDAKSPQKGGATPGPSRRPMKGSPSKGFGRSALGDKTNNNAKTPSAAGGNLLFGGHTSPKDGSPGKKSPTKGKKPMHLDPRTPGAKPLKPAAFRTPVANIGRMGAMKQRMAEMMDAERLASAGMPPTAAEPAGGAPQNEAIAHWTDGLTEAELYPEVEYMPPSHLTRPAVYDPPLELDGLIGSDELAKQMTRPNFYSAWGLDGPSYAQVMPDPEPYMASPKDTELQDQFKSLLKDMKVRRFGAEHAEDDEVERAAAAQREPVKKTASAERPATTSRAGATAPTAHRASTVPAPVRAAKSTTSSTARRPLAQNAPTAAANVNRASKPAAATTTTPGSRSASRTAPPAATTLGSKSASKPASTTAATASRRPISSTAFTRTTASTANPAVKSAASRTRLHPQARVQPPQPRSQPTAAPTLIQDDLSALVKEQLSLLGDDLGDEV